MTTNNHPAHGPVSLDRLHQISEILSKAAAQSDGGNLGYAMADAVKVIDGAIAAFGAEPVLYAAEETLAYAKMGELHLKCLSQPMGDAVIPLYTAPPAPVVQPVMFIDGDISASDAEKLAAVIREWDDAPAPERDRVRREHAEWSQATFGDVGPVGPLKHLSKEALEAAAEPGDLSEWADMQFLLWDAQLRAGISDEQITQAMVEKLAINKQREWPEPKDGEPRLHIKKAGNSPVTPDCWIPVSERMPEIGVVVFAWDGESYIKSEYLGIDPLNEGSHVWIGTENVTHWMPLPAAPQQEVQGE